MLGKEQLLCFSLPGVCVKGAARVSRGPSKNPEIGHFKSIILVQMTLNF
jgi:hypothetical protein